MRQKKVFKQEVTTQQPRLVTSVDMPKKSEVTETANRIPAFGTDVVGISILIFIFVGVSVGGFAQNVWWGLGAGAAAAAIVVLWRSSRILDRVEPNFHEITWQDVQLLEEEQDEIDADSILLNIDNARQVGFRQPRPGEFAKWIGAVMWDHLEDTKPFGMRITLSQRTAESRGWSRDMYKTMINMFFETELVYEGRNRVPEPTDKGIEVWSSWLEWSVPAPSIRNSE